MGFGIDINYLGVLVAAIVGFVIGALWYSPVLFGNRWMKLMKFTKKDIEKGGKSAMMKSMIIAFIAVLIMATVIDVLIRVTFVETLKDAFFFGILVWVGFIGTTFLNRVLWDGKPVELYLIQSSHYLVVLIVMSVVLVLF